MFNHNLPDVFGNLYDRLPKRFTVKIRQDQSTGCWCWLGIKNANGYGTVAIGSRSDNTKRSHPAHRVLYELCVETIPAGYVIDHLCKNRGCVNPFHLEVVTQKINVERSNAPSAINAKKTHCKRGHLFSLENTEITSIGYRKCILCRRFLNRRSKAKRRHKNFHLQMQKSLQTAFSR